MIIMIVIVRNEGSGKVGIRRTENDTISPSTQITNI